MTTGRNDPCPCGSGKKFKKCCLAKGRAAGGQRPANVAASPQPAPPCPPAPCHPATGSRAAALTAPAACPAANRPGKKVGRGLAGI
jgi:hypothetical protein